MSVDAESADRRRRWNVLVGVGLAAATAYSFAALPLRPWLLAQAPAVLAALTGSRPALVAVGALAAAESRPWLLPLLAGIVSIVKFHWVFWGAGRLWGDAALARVAGDSPRARRSIARAEELVRRYQVLAVVVTYVPFMPREVVHVALGTAGVPLRRFVVVDLTAAAVTQAAMVAVGAWLGDSAVSVVKSYARYAGWVALVVGVVMVTAAVRAWRRRLSRRSPR